MWGKEEAISQGSFVWFLLLGTGMVVIKKLLSEDRQEKSLFIKGAEILYGINSEHIAWNHVQ